MNTNTVSCLHMMAAEREAMVAVRRSTDTIAEALWDAECCEPQHLLAYPTRIDTPLSAAVRAVRLALLEGVDEDVITGLYLAVVTTAVASTNAS